MTVSKKIECCSAWAMSQMRSASSQLRRDVRFLRSVWSGVWKNRRFSGQGTTEYAILVGVLVVIAILAITVFRPKIQELWDAISSGINGL